MGGDSEEGVASVKEEEYAGMPLQVVCFLASFTLLGVRTLYRLDDEKPMI